MCGIAGIVGGRVSRATIENMVAVQSHRGPDASSAYINTERGVALGHCRLSVLDLSDSSNQPMWSQDGRFVIVFNGEIYNYLELKEELSDYCFQSAGDTEVILAAYHAWGRECLKRFIGIFAFAIWDSVSGELFCARDHLGVKPFYYHNSNTTFVFASEIKALLNYGVQSKVNDRILWSYLCEGVYDHSRETFFDGIHALEPGSWILVKAGNLVQEQRYWSLPAIVEQTEGQLLGEEEAGHKLRELLHDAVRLQIRSDVPLGIHLTGGLDSSALLWCVRQHIDDSSQIRAFTGAYDDPSYDEVPFALAAAESACSILHKTARIHPHEFWEIASSTQYAQEQPFGGLPTMVYWQLESVINASGIKVVLEGQGGDELFGGYRYYLGEHLADLSRETGSSEEVNMYRQYYGVELVKQLLENALLRKKTHQDGSMHLALDCVEPDFRACYHATLFPTPSDSYLTNARLRDLCYTKVPRVLRFNDRMSMAFGLELRVPFLDWRLVELSFVMPPSCFFKNGHSKAVLRAAMWDLLPDSVRLAPKRSVVTPQSKWFSGALREGIVNVIESSELFGRGYLNRARARERFDQFCQTENPSNSFFIWQWLNLDLWFREFNVS